MKPKKEIKFDFKFDFKPNEEERKEFEKKASDLFNEIVRNDIYIVSAIFTPLGNWIVDEMTKIQERLEEELSQSK